MWADTLLAAERAHLLRLLAWAASSVLVGTALLAIAGTRAADRGLLRHFAVQMAAWGVVEGAIAATAWRSLALRDYIGAMRLDRTLWLAVGLDAGYISIGATLAVAGWTLARHAGAVGAGTAIVVQGCALLALHLLLLSVTMRFA